MSSTGIFRALLRPGVRAIDRRLRRRLKIVEFSDDPDCVYRIRQTKADKELQLPDVLLTRGAPVLEFHWWNEHLPPVEEDGLRLDWGVRMLKKMVRTHQLLAHELASNPELQGVQAIWGTTAMFAADSVRWERRVGRIGYSLFHHRQDIGYLDFWERVWAWALWHTYQAGTSRVLRPSEISRTDVWMSAAELQRRYADPQADRADWGEQ